MLETFQTFFDVKMLESYIGGYRVAVACQNFFSIYILASRLNTIPRYPLDKFPTYFQYIDMPGPL